MLIACLSIPHSLIASCKSSVLMAETTAQATSQKTNNKIFVICYFSMWLPRWLSGKKNLPANAGDTGDSGSVPGSGRAPGEEYGKPLQYSCLENPADKGAWWATPLWAIVHKVTESQTWLSNWACTLLLHTDNLLWYNDEWDQNLTFLTIHHNYLVNTPSSSLVTGQNHQDTVDWASVCLWDEKLPP